MSQRVICFHFSMSLMAFYLPGWEQVVQQQANVSRLINVDVEAKRK